jgi:hypothetical protein
MPQVLRPPGEFHDGPVYVRVARSKAGAAWPTPFFRQRIDQFRFRSDPAHDYVPADNSHSAFVYCRWLQESGVNEAALSVVRPIDLT